MPILEFNSKWNVNKILRNKIFLKIKKIKIKITKMNASSRLVETKIKY